MWLSKIKKYFLVFCVTLGVALWAKGYASDMQPFLYLPFSYRYYNSFTVSEAWWYSGATWYLNLIGSWEYAIHGIKQHSAIDYALPYWAPVLAPMSWYMIASYHNAFLKEKWYVRLFQWTQLHYGLGWYVQIWNPEKDIFIILWHLSSIDSMLPVSPPYATWWKKWVSRRDPTWVTYDTWVLQTMINDPKTYPWVVFVKKWQRIWTVWVSGIERDNSMPSSIDIPRQPSFPQPTSWDEPHIHLEVFTVLDWKKQLLDPYNIYRDARAYPDSNTIRKSLWDILFVQSAKWRIRYADEK